MKIKDLRNIAKEQGVHYNEQDVLERADLVAVLVNSGRVGVIDNDDGDDDGGEGDEGAGEGKEEVRSCESAFTGH